MISRIINIPQKIKFCSGCKIFYPKTKEFFYSRKNSKDGFRPRCKRCGNKDSEEWRKNNWERIKDREIERKKQWNKENRKRCNQIQKEYHNRNRDKNNKKSREAYHEFKEKNPEESKKRSHKYALKHRYNIELEEYENLLEKQNYKCKICGGFETALLKGKIRKLSVDHDHKTGKIRGILCHSCNNILGRAKDNPLVLVSCIKYLKENKEVEREWKQK